MATSYREGLMLKVKVKLVTFVRIFFPVDIPKQSYDFRLGKGLLSGQKLHEISTFNP